MFIWKAWAKSMMNKTEMSGQPAKKAADLNAAFVDLKARNENIRARDAAEKLGVSEGELVACRIGEGIIRLDGPFGDIIKAMPKLGTVMVLTRNDHVVHEKVGEFANVSVQPTHGIVLNHDIDLRLFMGQWAHGFAVTEAVRSGVRHSLQFFGADGTAIHKIYVREDTNKDAFDEVVAQFTSKDQAPGISVTSAGPMKADRPDADIDVEAFRAAWAGLQDTHEFFGMLRDHGVGRQQAMRLIGEEFASEVEASAVVEMLERAAEDQLPIMCFVGNSGCIQIHTGPVKTLKEMGPWFNVLDPNFNLHLRTDRVARAWVVRKPTRDGVVTSLELFDDKGQNFVQFFGERKPGVAELDGWRDLAESLPRAPRKEAA